VSTKTSRLALRNQQIADLIKRLHETEHELQHLTGGEVDAVVGDGGKTYLLREAQERLHQSAVVQRELAAMQPHNPTNPLPGSRASTTLLRADCLEEGQHY
jgi:hypothetical protein